MPIAFARLEFVKRSEGKNACAKSAYNSRDKIEFKGSQFFEPKSYDWSNKEKPIFHCVLLPKGAKKELANPEYLWNLAEVSETRRNSQTAMEMVIALPDDKVISINDRIVLAKTFMQNHFVNQGFAAQIDIHPPDKREGLNGEEGDHNWHAHALITSRRVRKDGKQFESHKPRDLVPSVRGGRVVSGTHWGKLWAQHQNAFFEEKGLDLRVDTEGVVAQKHLGPVRMRGRAFSLLYENELRISLNTIEAKDPRKVLDKITQVNNVFTISDVNKFCYKHIEHDQIADVLEAFWKQDEIVPLFDPESQEPTNRFTTQTVLLEEKHLLRLGDQICKQPAFQIKVKKSDSFSKSLNTEQKRAFNAVISGSKLACIEGYAGTGKSALLGSLKEAYEDANCIVRGFGPDSSTAAVLKERGFSNAENVYSFLFSHQNGKRPISKNREVWIIDEAGKLGNRPFLELLKLAKRYDSQIILAGDSAQLPSVERGEFFRIFSERYGAHYLVNIQRQQKEEQQEIARKLASGKLGQALDGLNQQGAIVWERSKESAVEALIKQWAEDKISRPNESTLIIAHSNREIKALNEMARVYRIEAGELKGREFECDSTLGKIYVSEGDEIEFRKNDKEVGVTNGLRGVLTFAEDDKFTVQITEEGRDRTVTFNPHKFRSFQLGYATTYYRSQGRTVERAYVLHSPLMNKEMFYVGLTRHVKKAELYVSMTDAQTLSDIKMGVFSSAKKFSTLDYTTLKDLESERLQQARLIGIQEMRSSNSILDRLKGLGLASMTKAKLGFGRIIEKYQDVAPDRSFFDYRSRDQQLSSTYKFRDQETEIKVDIEKMKCEFRSLRTQACGLDYRDMQLEIPLSNAERVTNSSKGREGMDR